MKRLLQLLLAFFMLVSYLPEIHVQANDEIETTNAVHDDELFETVNQQVRTYLKSLNKPNAADDAAMAIVTHGITGNGKPLNVNENHPLTAILTNSEVGQAAVVDSVYTAIEYMLNRGLSKIYVQQGLYWYSDKEMFQDYSFYLTFDEDLSTRVYSVFENNMEKRNSYDDALIWIGGNVLAKLEINRTKITENKVTYSIKANFNDAFDFRNNNESVSKDIVSILGSVLFREFEWTSTIQFEVTVPYTCDHDGDNYHFIFDNENKKLTSYGNDEFTINNATLKEYTNSSSSNNTQKTIYNQELDEPISLMHDQPWELEYTLTNPTILVFSDTDDSRSTAFNLGPNAPHYVMFTVRENQQTIYYGVRLINEILVDGVNYKISFKNEVNKNGNIIYLSVYNQNDQRYLIKNQPMDDKYIIEGNDWVLLDDSSDDLSGVDLYFKSFGNQNHSFKQQGFELKVWEDGKEDNISHFKSKTVQATCTNEGYVEYTCDKCGYSYKETFASKLDHTYGDWKTTKQATCTENGIRRKTCTKCNHYVEETIAKLGHQVVTDSKVDPTCANTGLTEGTHCSRCKKVITKQEVIDKLNHNYQTIVIEPTCETDGYTKYTCKDCGYSYQENVVNALNHTWGKAYTYKDATCASDGIRRTDCTRCDSYVDRAIPKLEHRIVTTSKVDPTCTSTGLTEGSYCSRCNEVIAGQQVIDKLAHDYKSVVTEPTCSTYGYTTHTCQNCNLTTVDSKTEMLSHTFKDYISDNNATYESDGTKTAKCENCSETHTIIDEGSKLDKLPSSIISSTYIIKDGLMSNITLGISVLELMSKLEDTDNIKVFKNGEASLDSLVSTGMEVQLIINGEVVDKATTVIYGDVNGDGNITITDMLAVKSHLLNKTILEGAYNKAADTSNDNEVSITDFIQIKAHILGKSNIGLE